MSVLEKFGWRAPEIANTSYKCLLNFKKILYGVNKLTDPKIQREDNRAMNSIYWNRVRHIVTSERSRHIVTSGEIREQWINPPTARNRIYAWWRHFTTTTRMLRGKRLYSVFFLLWRIVRDTNLAAKCILVAGDVIVQMSEVKKHTYAVFTRDTFTRGKLTFYCTALHFAIVKCIYLT